MFPVYICFKNEVSENMLTMKKSELQYICKDQVNGLVLPVVFFIHATDLYRGISLPATGYEIIKSDLQYLRITKGGVLSFYFSNMYRFCCQISPLMLTIVRIDHTG